MNYITRIQIVREGPKPIDDMRKIDKIGIKSCSIRLEKD
jgi:hypothetical protein